MKKALIVQGGWQGHQPKEVSEVFRKTLEENGFEVEVSDTLDVFLDAEKLMALDLIIPVWTMGKITKEQAKPVLEAVASGVGLAGCHGGMCDSFRENTDWQFMTGGQWVAHPGGDGVEHSIHIRSGSSPLLEGIQDFTVKSEQYYLHVDPANEILATTTFPVVDGNHAVNGVLEVPVTWTKRWGKGRVFYCSLGHHADIVEIPTVLTMMTRGFIWAAEGKEALRKVVDK